MFLFIVTPGKYESYWHFTHKGRRFGHWLGLEVIVDKKVPHQEPSRSQVYFKSDDVAGEGTSNIQQPITQYIDVTSGMFTLK